MYIYNLIIACVVSLCFCQELQNQNVESSDRIRRTPEKPDEYMQNVLKDNNILNLAVASKSKAPLPLSLQPKERHKLTQITKDLQKNLTPPKINQDIPTNHPLRQILQSPPKDVSMRKDIKKLQMQPKNEPKRKDVKIKRLTLPSGNNYDENLNVPGKVPEKKLLKPRVKEKKNKDLKKKTGPKPTSFTENPVEDIKATSKAQVTTPNQMIDSQIEKPEPKHLDKNLTLSEDDKLMKYTHLYDFSPKMATTDATSKPTDDTNLADAKQNSHRIEASINKLEDNSKPSQDSNEVHNQLEVPEIHADKSNIIKMEEIMKAKRKKSDANLVVKYEGKEHSEVSMIKETPVSTRKVMKIVPLTRPPTDELVDKTQTTDKEVKNSSDDAYQIAKPLVDSLENKSIEAIEIKQRNYAEIVEKQPSTTNESNKPSAWQDCGTQTEGSNYQESYMPDATVVPSYYEYPYNQYNFNKFYYRSNPYNNLQRNEDPLQRTWRSWINTEVVIRIKNPPNTEIQTLPTTQVPQQYTKYNTVHKDVTPMYTPYPYYVYPSVCYGTNNGYYQ